MPTVSMYDRAGQPVGEIQLNDRVFGAEINEALMHQAVVMYLANRRSGTASSKTRSEVRGGGRKPWRQKGTGRARHGTIRSPLWKGGGVTFGPQPRSFRQSMTKKAKRLALISALSSKVRDGELVVLDEMTMTAPKTRDMAELLKNLDAVGTSLVVTEERSREIELSARNIPGVTAMAADSLNAYEVLAHRKLVLTRAAVQAVEEGLAS